jgi:hypothetical protein
MPTSAFEYFVGRRNAAMVQLLERNPEVSGFMQALLEHLVDWSKEHGVRYEDIKLDVPFVSHDGYIRARISR